MIGELFVETDLVGIILLQFTGCIALGLTFSFLLRRSAARAHQILLISLIASLLLPSMYAGVHIFGFGLLKTPIPMASEVIADSQPIIEKQPSDVSQAGIDYSSALIIPETVSEPSLAEKVTPLGNTTTGFLSGRTAFCLCWVLAGIMVSMRLALQFILGIRLLNRSTSVTASHLHQMLISAKYKMGVSGSVNIQSSDQIQSPVIWCWRRTPVLLIQKNAESLASSCDWEAVFCHELAHWKRLDHVSGLITELLTVLVPWHPLVWWTRHRLMYLSELACDDWVLAAGQSETDYAESLLNLTAQKQLAFLPAIMGKEHKMKQRINRIIKGRTGNPTVHKYWRFLVITLTLCTTVGIALAQRRPQEDFDMRRDRPEFREAQIREMNLIGRRNVLHRLLDQLDEQLRETEASLQDAGDEPAERRQILQSERDTLRQQYSRIEQQIARLEQPRPNRGDPQVNRLRERLNDLEVRADELRQKLARLDDSHPDQAHDIQIELARIDEEMNVVRQQLERQNKNRPNLARIEREREELQARRDQISAEMQELESVLMTLRENENQARVIELRDRLNDRVNEERRLTEVQHELDQQLEREQSRRQSPIQSGHQPKFENPERQERQMSLREQILRTEQILHRLEDTNQGDSIEAHELRARLDHLTENLHLELEQSRSLRPDTNTPSEQPVRRTLTGQTLQPWPTVPSSQYQDDDRRSNAEVDVLRDQVKELNEQMQQVMHMLELIAKDQSPTDEAR